MKKIKPKPILLSESELKAAHIACSNYTPARGTPWKQSAQSRAGGKFQMELMRMTCVRRTLKEGK